MSFQVARSVARNGGFSILEGVVGAAVGGLVLYGLSAGMINSLKVSKTVEAKTDANNFHQLISLKLANSKGCKELLPAGFKIPSSKLPVKEGGVCNPSTCVVEIPSLALTGDTYTPEKKYGSNLEFAGANLVLVKHRATLGTNQEEYEATLKYTLARAGKGQGTQYSREFPLLIQFSKANANAEEASVNSCFGIGATASGDETCDKLGGTWLKNGDSQHFAKERCHFGGEINLSSTEWPDALNRDGTISPTGFRPIECRYTDASGNIRTYKCPGRTSTSRRAGRVCRFDGSTWRNSYISSYDGATPVYPPVYDTFPCQAGLVAAKTSDATVQLRFDEPLALAYFDTRRYFVSENFNFAEYVAESDRLNSVVRCQPKHDVDNWVPCSNGTDPAGARAGAKGSCLYVRNGVVSGISNLGLASPPNVNNYTGWIYVATARTFGMMKTDNTAVPTITEAKGTPCFQVEVLPSLYRAQEFAPFQSNEPPISFNSLSYSDFQKVDQCLVQLHPTKGTAQENGADVLRFTTLSCSKNAGLEGDPMTWTEVLGDAGRLSDALQAMSISLTAGTTADDPSIFAKGVRKIYNKTGTVSITSLDQLDTMDIVQVVFEDLDDDGNPEKCLFRRTSRNWGGPAYAPYSLTNIFPSTPHPLPNVDLVTATIATAVGAIDKQTAANSLNPADYEPRISFQYDGENYYRISPAGVFQPNLSCTRASDVDVVPYKSLDALKTAITNQIAAENKRDSEYLTRDTCAYFEEVAVVNRAIAKIGSLKDYKGDLNASGGYDPPAGLIIPTSLAQTEISTKTEASNTTAPISSLTELQKRYSGWVWLSNGLPVQRFRNVDSRVIQKVGKVYATDAFTNFSGDLRFRQVELTTGLALVPVLTSNGPNFFAKMGAFTTGTAASGVTATSHETNLGQRRPLVPISGELCTRGVRLRAN